MTAPPYQIGIAVQQLEDAQQELTRAFGLEWEPTIEVEVAGWPLRIAHSLQGPPHLELIEGPAGSPWDATAGTRLDHLGWWAQDPDAEKQRHADDGAVVELEQPGFTPKFSYHRLPVTGLRFELVDAAAKPAYYARLGR
jgi:glyoxalase/bleomycin resistance protein/dioxygenase superfamily protein